ncbi:hypothetical protein PIB30_058810 [Stylosanthes scabra]|uniref:Uncharacterized protein n=1 Tax=Stylosanthes scabra TaxID=79078 RepID=A0ABU6QJQ2_9FABA|nr:hypothetical protein [Stylosanthes scabra]
MSHILGWVMHSTKHVSQIVHVHSNTLKTHINISPPILTTTPLYFCVVSPALCCYYYFFHALYDSYPTTKPQCKFNSFSTSNPHYHYLKTCYLCLHKLKTCSQLCHLLASQGQQIFGFLGLGN